MEGRAMEDSLNGQTDVSGEGVAMAEKQTFYEVKQKTKVVKDKGKNLIFGVIYSRTIVTVLLAAVQVFSLFVMFGIFKNIAFLSYLFSVLGAITLIYVVNSDENPAFKLAWAIPICLFPVFGIALYFFVALNSGNRILQRRLNRRIVETEKFVKTNERVKKRLEDEDGELRGLAHYIQNQNHFPVYDRTKVTFFSLGEEKYDDLLLELEKAEKFIFLEYFIINDGQIWNGVLDILKRKVKEGVEVRVMYDGLCAMASLPFHYPSYLQSLGIRAKMFAPIRPVLSTAQNNRDHRKILVIDGKVAYNGGINLADEYMNKKVRFGHWKDTAVKLEGEAVDSFTIMFLQMWNLSEDGNEEYENYVRLPQDKVFDGEMTECGFVMPFNDDPTNRLDVAKEVYLDIISRAERYVHITTPYLIPDNEMITALRFAARRGVDVKIIMPHIPDKKMIFAIGRTYYPQLLEAGVEIYEYTPGFIHAKEIISDDQKAVIGTVNLDFRSMYEHFECATYIYKNPVIQNMEEDYKHTIEKSQKINMQFIVDLPLWYKVLGQVGRLFGPLV